MSPKVTKSEREMPAHWVREINACIKRNQSEIDRYVRHCNWYRGNLNDLIDPDSVPRLADQPWRAGLDNMHTFVTDASIAQTFFRNPRGAIRTPGPGRGVWTPGLARVEATMLNDTIEQIGYFRRARRRLLDARNGPYGILKITYDCDMVVDMETIEDAREEAAKENQALVLGRPKQMEAREDQIHSAHIDSHRELLAAMERGDIKAPKSLVKYLRKHIAVHEAMRTSERPTETARDAMIVVRRVSPLDWYYDVTPDDIADARWFCHTYLMRRVDAVANNRFAKAARDAVSEAPSRWVRQGVKMPSGLRDDTFDNSDVMVRVYEVFDRVEGVIREFFEGGSEMADQRNFTMRSVQPSGPYSILMFKPDPLEAAGISPPIAWAAEQHADVALQSAIVDAAIEGARARGVFDKSAIPPEKVEEIVNGPSGTWFPIDLPPNKDDIRKVMADAPTVQIQEQTLAIRADVRGRIAQSSGLGSQRTLSGDKAGSATEAAITSGAADAISEDQASILDDASAYDFKMIVRLTRKCMTKAQVVEVVGPDAEKWYPETWADRDIVNDRNVYVVPGSSRRRSTDVQSKLTTDFIIGMAALPAFQTPEGQSLILEAARRVADDMGLAGLDWDAVDNAQKMAAMFQQQMAMAGAGAPEGENGAPASNGKSKPPKNRQRPAEQTEPSVAAQEQGMMNTGGGRVATGASAGDQIDLMRARSGMA